MPASELLNKRQLAYWYRAIWHWKVEMLRHLEQQQVLELRNRERAYAREGEKLHRFNCASRSPGNWGAKMARLRDVRLAHALEGQRHNLSA